MASGPTRREFLAGLAAAGLAGGLGAPALAAFDGSLARGGVFRTGVRAGSPNPHGVTLMAAVDDLEADGRLLVEVARDSGFATVVARRTVGSGARTGGVARARIAPSVLDPGAEYWYRFATRDVDSPVGRFRTLRATDSGTPVRVAFFSCQGWQAGYYTAHAGLAAEPDIDLALCLGDYIYELTDDTGPAERVDTIGPDRDGFAQTLAEYRQKYRLYQSDANLQAMHAAHPFLAVWDNHELADDSPGHLQGKPVRVPLARRMAFGRQAFWDFLPVEKARTQWPGLYRKVTLGAAADLFLLDLHSYADPPTAGTYLGARQLAWLQRELAASRATWKLLASSTSMMGTDLAPGVPINLNQWDGYGAERRALMESILANGAGGVVVLSGDLHTFIAGTVTTTGRSDGTGAAVEFLGGAITSNGLIDGLPPGPDRDATARALEAQGRATNPHFAFLDLLAKGYAVLEARRDELLVAYRSPESILTATSPIRTLQRFRVLPDHPLIELV
jgi:alkaline phosphatase D